MSEVEKLVAKLAANAAARGTAAKAQDKVNEDAAKNRRAIAKDASESAAKDVRALGGFATPMFVGLSATAGDLGQAVNDLSTSTAREYAEAMARSFSASYTGATSKTDKGGTNSGYVTHILLGQNGERVRRALQDRLEYWWNWADSADDKNRQERKADAAKYTVVCGDAPLADGSWPKGKDGVEKRPRHKGRPEATINGVFIPAKRGTDRKAMLADASALYHEYGEAFLDVHVLDAFLSNGGKYESDASIASLATTAMDAISELLTKQQGNLTADAGYLTIAIGRLNRIAKEGFATSEVAPDNVVPLSQPETADEADAGEGEGEGEGGTEAEAEAAPDTTPERKPRGRAARGGL